MQTLASFSAQDLERLFLTYKQNQDNYSKIKDKVIGEDAELQYKSNRKSSFFFFGALTFVVAISSAFSLIAADINSFGALWTIWGIAFILFTAWSVFYYKTNYQILEKNRQFFQKFEVTAQNSQSLDDFKKNW